MPLVILLCNPNQHILEAELIINQVISGFPVSSTFQGGGGRDRYESVMLKSASAHTYPISCSYDLMFSQPYYPSLFWRRTHYWSRWVIQRHCMYRTPVHGGDVTQGMIGFLVEIMSLHA